MSLIGAVETISILEKDASDEFLWLWIYPTIDKNVREAVEKYCAALWDLTEDNDGNALCVQFNKHWIHLHTAETSTQTKVCLVLISSDFNPSLYSTLAIVFLQRYVSTTNPVSLLEIYLEVFKRGCFKLENGQTFDVRNYAISRVMLKDTKIKDVISLFGLEVILIATAILLKKRIVVYHKNYSELANICRALPLFAYHRPVNWNTLFPLVLLSQVDVLRNSSGGYVAGFSDLNVETRSDLFDIFVNAVSKEITVAAHAREMFIMGRLHKDLATFIVQCAEDEKISDQQCVLEIAGKNTDLINNLKAWGSEDESGGKLCVSAETIRSKHLPPAAETFLVNLASVEGLLKL